MTERYISFDLDDPRADKLAEALTNKTCKKILGALVEKEMNASEVASNLNLPLNTIGYNLEKLVDAGLIEKSKGFLWSTKGKKIERYKISDRRIVISPKRIGMSILPVIVVLGILAILIKFFLGFAYPNVAYTPGPQEFAAKGIESERAASDRVTNSAAGSMYSAANEGASGTGGSSGYDSLVSFGYEWLWFLLGAFAGMIIFLIWNRKRIWD